jgi:tetratricopeptide (TPR) repeat protein
MSSSNDNAALPIAALTVVAAGIWAIFNNCNNSKNSNNDQNTIQTEALFNQAVALSQQANYPEATKIFLHILQTNPQHAPTYNYLAWIYAIHNFQLDQALAFANNAVQLATNPVDRACFIDTLAEVYARRQELDTAIQLSLEYLNILQSINQYPSSPTTYFRLASCYQIKQDFRSAYNAIQHISQFKNLGARDYATIGDICYLMGNTVLMKGVYHEAIHHFNNADNQYRTAIQVASNQNISQDILLFQLSCNTGSKGVAFYYIEDYHNSKLAHQEAYKIYPYSPYPPTNLAQIAARDKNRQEMLYWLGVAMPYVIDHPPFIQQGHLVSTMLNDLDFYEYKDDVLGLLLNHGKINSLDYQRHLKSWMDQKSNFKYQVANFSQQNFYAEVAGVAGNVEGNFMYQPQSSSEKSKN